MPPLFENLELPKKLQRTDYMSKIVATLIAGLFAASAAMAADAPKTAAPMSMDKPAVSAPAPAADTAKPAAPAKKAKKPKAKKAKAPKAAAQ
jgi:hypothetical protein